MPVIEISMKRTAKGHQIKFRERSGRNSRGRWQTVTIGKGWDLAAAITWEAIRTACLHIIRAARAGSLPPASVPTRRNDT